MATWKLCPSTTLSSCTLCQQKPYLSKGIPRFSKSLPHLEDVGGGNLGVKFQVRRYFTFPMARWEICPSTIFEILPLSTCTLCQQKSYISNGIQPTFAIFDKGRRFSGRAFGWKVSGAQVFYFCNGKVKTLRIDNTFNLYTVPAKILYLKMYSHDFRNLCLSSKMLRVGIWVASFWCAAILLLHWQGENFAHGQHLKFCNFQRVHCASKNPISPKVFNRVSKSLPQLEDVQVGHLGWKFQVRRWLTFAMAIWKLCAWTTFEILPRSTCTLCQKKSYISKGIQPIFEIFASRRRCWGWASGGKVWGAQVFYFCNAKVKTLHMDNIWNFATFNLYTVPAKILCLQRYSHDFLNLCLSWKMLRVGIWAESFRCAGILLLQWQRENVWHRQHLKFCHVQPVHCPRKNPMSPKVFTWFSKSLLQLEHVEGGHLGGKFQVRRCLTFAMARWKLFASTTSEIFPRSTCSRYQQKSYVSQGIQPIFEILGSARRCWGWTFGWKVSGAQVFYFCYGNVKTLRIDNIWNFATFNMYTVPAKILYLQRYSHDLWNLCLSSKILRMGIWVGSFWCAAILFLHWQGENFAHRQHLKFCNFQRGHCASKNPISRKVFNRVSKYLPQLEDVQVGHLGGKFQVRM